MKRDHVRNLLLGAGDGSRGAKLPGARACTPWKRRQVYDGPFHVHPNSILAALKAPKLESPGRRPGFRNSPIVWRPERARAPPPFQGGATIAGTLPGALPQSDYLRAVGAATTQYPRTEENAEMRLGGYFLDSNKS